MMDDKQQQNNQSQQDGSSGNGRTEQVRQKAMDAYDGARQSVTQASRRASEGMSQAGRKASDGIDEAPLIALAGGFAVGALIASLLPRTRAETELLRPVSNTLTDKARTAAEAAREAGTSRLRELGLTPESGREKIRELVQGVEDAARTSAQAAVGSVRNEG